MDVQFSPQSPMMADYLRHLFPPDADGNLQVKSTNAITSFFRSQDVADLHECIAYLYRPASRRITRSGRHVHPVNLTRIERDTASPFDSPIGSLTLLTATVTPEASLFGGRVGNTIELSLQ